MTFSELLATFQPLFFLKIGALLIFALYGMFTFVMVNQVRVMNSIFKQRPFGVMLKYIALLQLFFALSLFLIGFAIL